MANGEVAFVFCVLLCIQCLLTRTKAQGTTDLPVTRPLDIDDDEISGDDSTTIAELTTPEDLFSTSTPFSDSFTTPVDIGSPTVNDVTTQQTGRILETTSAFGTTPLSDIGIDDNETTTGSTDIPNTGGTTSDNGRILETTSPVATTPLSDIGIDDDDTTPSSTTSQQGPLETTESTTVNLETFTSTSSTLTTVAQSSPIQASDSSTAGTTTAADPNVMADCDEDRDCASNQHCVAKDSSSKCHCKPGYSFADNGLCIERVKHFGGRVHFQDDDTASGQRFRGITERLINSAFASQPWFRVFNILSANNDSASVSYELITDDEAIVDSQLVNRILEEFMETDPSLDGCQCEQEQCVTENVILLASATCQDTGQSDQVLCDESTEISQYCDTRSTICTASDDGRISCPCREGYVFNTLNSCIRQICVNDADCNYGSCDDAVIGGTCLCQWGFDGTHCDSPWLLVTTILAALLAAVLLAVMAYHMRRYMKQRKAKIADKQEALSREPKYGYRKKNENYNLSPWPEGPVTLLSYNQIGNETVTPNASVGLQSSGLTPPESEVHNIRNVAQRRLSSRRQLAVNEDNIDFVLPSQTLE